MTSPETLAPARPPPNVPTVRVHANAMPIARAYEDDFVAPGSKLGVARAAAAAVGTAGNSGGDGGAAAPPGQPRIRTSSNSNQQQPRIRTSSNSNQQQQQQPTARRSPGTIVPLATRPMLRASGRPQLQANRSRTASTASTVSGAAAAVAGDQRSLMSNQARKVFRESQTLIRGQPSDRMQAARLLALDVDQMVSQAKRLAGSSVPSSTFNAAVSAFDRPYKKLQASRHALDDAATAEAGKQIASCVRALIDAIAALPK